MNNSNASKHETIRWVVFSLVLLAMLSMGGKMLAGSDPVFGFMEQANNPKVDKQADKILKQMSDYLTSMQQFSYKSNGMFEVVDKNNKKLKQSYTSEVFIKRPNKMRVNVKNEKRDASVFYDGKQFAVLGRNANMYAIADAPPTLDAALDTAREKFLLDPPGSDILYTNPYTGLMEQVTHGQLLDEQMVNGKACNHLAFKSKDVDWEIWVQKGSVPLPLRYKIISKNEPERPEFIVDYSDWKQDAGPAAFADPQFVLSPPANSVKIPFMQLGPGPTEAQPKK